MSLYSLKIPKHTGMAKIKNIINLGSPDLQNHNGVAIVKLFSDLFNDTNIEKMDRTSIVKFN